MINLENVERLPGVTYNRKVVTVLDCFILARGSDHFIK